MKILGIGVDIVQNKTIKKLTKNYGGGGGGNKSIAFAGGLSRISEKVIIDFLNK